MPQLYDCVRYVDKLVPSYGPLPTRVTVLQVKRNGEWVDVPTVMEEEKDGRHQ